MPKAEPIELPKDVPFYMADAWFSCMHFAIGDENLLGQFREETGMTWTPGKAGLDRLIDEATGADREFVEAFVEWAHKNVWGSL